MDIRSVNTFWKAALVLIGVSIFNPIAMAMDAPENFQVVDGVAIYLGIVPAQLTQGHPKEHQESRMHGGAPKKGHRDHVVVALFYDATGKRIENAKVKGIVMEIGTGAQKKKLDAMKIADTITYGNYFDMPNKGAYHIKLWVSIPGMSHDIEAKFTHRHADR